MGKMVVALLFVACSILSAPVLAEKLTSADPLIFTWGVSGREVIVNVPDKDALNCADTTVNLLTANNTSVYIFAADMSNIVSGAKEIVFFESLTDAPFEITDDQLFAELILYNATETVYISPSVPGKVFYDSEVSVCGAFFSFNDGCMTVKASNFASLKELLDLILVIEPES